MLRIGNHAVVLLNHWDDIIEEHILEALGETTEATETATTLATLSGSTLRTLTSLSRSTLWAWTLRRTLSTLRTRTTETAKASSLARTACVQTIIHYDDARNSLTLGNQVVQNLSGVTLLCPAVLILTHTVLQIQNGEFLGGIGEILMRQIDMAATHLLGIGRPIEYLADRALRHILHLPEILVVGRNFDTTSPTAGTIVVQTVRIGHVSTVDIELIVVEAFILRL